MSFQKEIKLGIVASHKLAKQNSLKRKDKFSQWQSEHWCAQMVLCLIFQHGGHVIQSILRSYTCLQAKTESLEIWWTRENYWT